MREIQLTKGYVAYVDDADYERVSAHKWYAHVKKDGVYAHTNIEQKTVQMHRFILEAPRGMLVDHRDHDTLNNTRDNIRLATHSQNSQNKRLDRKNTSGVKGVHWAPHTKRWKACVRSQGKDHFIGYFSSLEEAAEAVRIKRLELHGSFSCDK